MSTVMGKVGWDGELKAADSGTKVDDGHLLVRVQLFAGRDITKPLKQNEAQGRKILCHISSSIFRIPPLGCKVVVAMPEGMQGMGVIIATIEKQPGAADGDTQIDVREGGGDRVVIDYGPTTDVVIRGRTVSMVSSNLDFVQVGGVPAGGTHPGVVIQAANGTGAIFQEALVSLFVSGSGADVGVGKSGLVLRANELKVGFADANCNLEMSSDGFYVWANTANLVSGAVYLGAAPDVSSPVLWGLSGSAGLPSPSVFVSKLV